MNRAEKAVEIDGLAQRFVGSQIALVADTRGLTVGQVTKLRRELNKVGAKARVVRNTLGRLAVAKVYSGKISDDSVTKFKGLLKGPSLVVFSDDPVAPAKVVTEFAKEKANEKFKVKGALFEGNLVDPAGVEALSKMPGRLELLVSLLRVIAAPATQIVRLIAAPGTQTVRVIEAHRQNLEKKEQGGAAA